MPCAEGKYCFRLHFDLPYYLTIFLCFRLTGEMDLLAVGLIVARAKKSTFITMGNLTVR